MESLLQKIVEFGNNIYDKTFGLLNSLPGVVKGLVSCFLLVIMITGLITFLKKSFKVFGIVILALLILVIIGSFIK